MKKMVLSFLLMLFFYPVFANFHKAPITDLTNPSTDSLKDPCAKINERGNALAAWISSNKLMSRYYNGTAWLPAVQISDKAFGDAQICFDDSNRGFAVWRNTSGAPSQVQASMFNGTTWSTPENISVVEDVRQPRIACNNAGEAVAVWMLEGKVQSATFNGTTWTTPDGDTFISETINDSRKDPAVAMVGSSAVVAWSNFFDLVARARFSSNSGVTWQPIQTITDGTNSTEIDSTAVDINAAGMAVVVFRNTKLVGQFIQASLLINGQWSIPETISFDQIPLLVSAPDVSINDNGKALAVFGGPSSQVASFFDGTQWTSPQTIGTTLGSLTDFSRVVLNNWDVAIGTWKGACDNILCATGAAFANGVWCPAQKLSGSEGQTGSNVVPSDMNESNQGIALWIQDLGGGMSQVQTRFGFPAFAPQVIQCLNRFPTQGEYFNRLSWMPMNSKQVRIQRNEQHLVTLPGSSKSYVDHNRSAAEQDSYSIFFLN